MHARHELRAARGARRPPVAVPGRGAPRLAVPARAPVGRAASRARRRRSASSSTEPPFEALDADFPIRLTTGRRLESYNTGVQSNRYRSPLHRGESLDLSPEDAERLGSPTASSSRVSSRRGSVEAPVRDRPVAAARARVHDAPLPGRGRHEPAHDRRDRPEVGHGRVQGGGDPGREARAGRARSDEEPSVAGAGVDRRAGRPVRGSPPVPAPSRPRPSAPRVDARARPAGDGWDGGARRDGPTGNTARGGHDARGATAPAAAGAARRSRSGSAGSARGRSTTSAARLTVPPPTPTASRRSTRCSRSSRGPPRVVHVCEDIACRCHGSDELIAAARGALRRARASCPTTARRRGIAARASASATARRPRSLDGRRRRSRSERVARARRRAAAVLDVLAGGEPRRRRRASRVPQAGESGAAPAAPRRRRRSDEPRRLPRPRRLRGAAARVRARARGRDPRGQGLEALGPRRRRLPDRASSGRPSRASRRGRTTSSATPTSPSRARSRTAC